MSKDSIRNKYMMESVFSVVSGQKWTPTQVFPFEFPKPFKTAFLQSKSGTGSTPTASSIINISFYWIYL